MTATNKVLIQAQNMAAADTTYYTSPAGGKGTILDALRSVNSGAGAVTVTVNLVRVSTTASAVNRIVHSRSIAVNGSEAYPELAGLYLGPGDFISLNCSVGASANVYATGRELT